MKRPVRAMLMMSACALLSACAGESKPLLHEAHLKLERGASGQGTLYEPSRSEDPFIKGQAQ